MHVEGGGTHTRFYFVTNTSTNRQICAETFVMLIIHESQQRSCMISEGGQGRGAVDGRVCGPCVCLRETAGAGQRANQC